MARSAFSVIEHLAGLRDSVVRRMVRDQATDKMAGLIVSGNMQIGDFPSRERDLVAAFQVGRETARGRMAHRRKRSVRDGM